jgi:hypothetical protein
VGGSPGSLLEDVQDVHRVRELRNVQDSMLQRRVDPDLPYTRAHRWHRLPVQWVESLLDASKLKTGQPSRLPREGPDVAARRAQPLERLVRHP